MRAVALSDDKNIKFLNENFINTWVLNADMKRLRDAKDIGQMSPLIQTIGQGWKRHSPVDCLIISPELELMGRQPVNELSWQNRAAKYRLFLVESLEGKRPGAGQNAPMPLSSSRRVVLDRIQPSIEILDTFRAPGVGSENPTVVYIDVTPFSTGGTLTIDIQVGRGAPVGSFDLFDGHSERLVEGASEGPRAYAWGIQPGQTGTLIHRFDKGGIFQLRATGGWVDEKGSINAFRARISVR